MFKFFLIFLFPLLPLFLCHLRDFLLYFLFCVTFLNIECFSESQYCYIRELIYIKSKACERKEKRPESREIIRRERVLVGHEMQILWYSRFEIQFRTRGPVICRENKSQYLSKLKRSKITRRETENERREIVWELKKNKYITEGRRERKVQRASCFFHKRLFICAITQLSNVKRSAFWHFAWLHVKPSIQNVMK